MMQESVFLMLGGFLSAVFLLGLLNARRKIHNRPAIVMKPKDEQLDLPMGQPKEEKETREMAAAHH